MGKSVFHPKWIVTGYNLVFRHGILVPTILLTLAAIIASGIIGETVYYLFGAPENLAARTLPLTIPLLTAPWLLVLLLIIFRRMGRIERELEHAEDTQRILLHSIPGAATYIDADRVYRDVNKTFEDWFGMKREDVVGRPVREVLGEESYLALASYVDDVLKGVERTVEIVRAFPVRGRMHGQITFTPDIDPDGHVRGYFTLLTDVSDIYLANERFRNFAEASSDWFWETDADGRYTYFSGEDEEASGVPPAEKIGKTRSEVSRIYNEDRELDLPSAEVLEIEAIVEARQPFVDRRYRLNGSDGVERYLSVSGKPFYDSRGDFVGYRGTGTDLTEKKKAENAFIELKHMYQQLVDISPDAIVLQTSENGRIAFANRAACRLAGVDDDNFDLVGKDTLDFIHPDYRDGARSRNQTVLAGGDAQPITPGIFVRNDGSSLHVERGVTPCQYEGKPAFISVIRDISARHEAQLELENSKARLSSILTIAPVAIIAISEDGTIEMFNAGAEEIFGYLSEEVIGGNINMLIPERYRHNHDAWIAAFAESEQKMRAMTEREPIHGLHRGGHEFPAEASISRENHPTGVLMTVAMRDITERQDAEENLRLALVDAEQANQAKSDFLATMSHELRTPLNAIIGFSDMIERQYFGALGSEKYSEYANDIQTSGKHLLALVNDILDLSAIEAGKQSLAREEFDIRVIANECIQAIIAVAKARQIEVGFTIPDDLPLIYADKRAIKQILFNLLSNAVKYTLKNGKIELRVAIEGSFHALVVRDTGIGIPPDKISTLTEPFVRTESDPHLAQEGTGLGLAIVKSLSDLHGGELKIESQAGVGTNVTVWIPGENLVQAQN